MRGPALQLLQAFGQQLCPSAWRSQDLVEGEFSGINIIITDTNLTVRKTHHLLPENAHFQHILVSLCDSHGL
jgi:hypothetical protein